MSDLQSHIIQQSWQGQTYSQVATAAGYSEGHIKDVAAQLWKMLSEALGERITKGNLRSRLLNRLKRTVKSATPTSLHPFMTSSAALVSAAIAIDSSTARESSVQQLEPLAQDAGFLGRSQALQKLHSLAQAHRIIVIQGEGGIGKTTLAQQYCQRFDRLLELPMAREPANITPAQSVVEEWLRQHFNEEPGRELGVTLSRLKQHLGRSLRHQQHSIGILIDNLEPALDGNGQFIAGHRHYVELLRALAEAGASVIVTSRDRLCEPGIKVHHYRLSGLAFDCWQQFFTTFTSGFSCEGSLSSALLPDEILSKMHQAYGGNAKAMEILCASVAEDYEGDLRAYWQENSADLLGSADLRNLVVSQVNRIQQLDADAYRVFCRLGCYRYQDQPRLRAEAVTALMWDVTPSRQRQTLNSLRDRSLVEFCKGEYWLHPVSRAEAIARLRQSEDWQQANQAAAQYWSSRVASIISVEDGLQALEAYYHLQAAEDYDAAAAVLLQSRHNQWRQFLPLASSLYRMGLLQPVVSAITQVLPHVEQGRSELNNILGDVYWITGRIHSAIACQKQTLTDAAKQLSQQEASQQAQNLLKRDAYYLKMLIVDAHLSIGLYCIDLRELTQAAEEFNQVIALAAGSAHQPWADKATVGLALVQACLGETHLAAALADGLYEQLTIGSTDQHGRAAYFLQMLGQVFFYIGELDKADVLHEGAIAFAEAGHYVQVKAKALTGLAMVQRQRGNYVQARSLHKQAISLCQTIGAQCDLAEAYFQFGQSIDQDQPLNEPSPADYFEQAIALFSDIRAPQQIKRILSAR
ncbi:MAG: NB-ARC domain-containing protein [Phormidesmis sp.]